MNTIGIRVKIYFFFNCDSQTVIANKASAANNWLALPKTGQIDIVCPLKVKATPAATVTVVATNLLVPKFDLSGFSFISKNSWKTYRPNLVVVSKVVNANAATANATNIVAVLAEIEKSGILSIKPATPIEKAVTGPFVVNSSRYFEEEKLLTAIKARTASIPSINIPPYPINLPSDSLFNCFEVVPLATIEWNPLTAPQATVTNNAGKRKPTLSSVKVSKAGSFNIGVAKINPITPAISSMYKKYEFR
jgi:hypothetical protein